MHQKNYSFYFFLGALINFIYVLIEIYFGFYTNSLSLITDAFHNLSDVLSLIISWIGYYLSLRKATNKRTYGFRKASILASLMNSLFLLVSMGVILLESFRKLFHFEIIQTDIMWKVALAGIFVNFGTALFFYQKDVHKSEEDINIKTAFLHLFSDGLITIGVILAAIFIQFTKFYWIDPLVSISICFIILFTTTKLLYKSLNMILDAVPENIDINEIQEFLSNLPEIREVHNLHIWALSTTEIALTVHLVKDNKKKERQLLTYICEELKNKYHIHYVTIQFEDEKTLENCKKIYSVTRSSV